MKTVTFRAVVHASFGSDKLQILRLLFVVDVLSKQMSEHKIASFIKIQIDFYQFGSHFFTIYWHTIHWHTISRRPAV